MDLYAQTAPFLSEDPQEQKQALQPPHKFWHAEFRTRDGQAAWIRKGKFEGTYDVPVPPIPIGSSVIAGPICHSFELAEQLALNKLARMEAKAKRKGYHGWHYVFIGPIKTDEKGFPL